MTPGQTLAEKAYEILRDRLVVLEIAPGSPVNDELLGHELGIGRTPMREALKRLEADHLVTVFPRRGTFASTVDITDIGEITEVRERLEPLAAGRAARLADAATRAELAALADTVAALDMGTVDARELMRYDMAVHRSIYRAAGSRLQEDVLVRYDDLATRIWCLVLDRLPTVGIHVAEHVDLLRHIAAGRADEAEALARSHVVDFASLIRSVV